MVFFFFFNYNTTINQISQLGFEDYEIFKKENNILNLDNIIIKFLVMSHTKISGSDQK